VERAPASRCEPSLSRMRAVRRGTGMTRLRFHHIASAYFKPSRSSAPNRCEQFAGKLLRLFPLVDVRTDLLIDEAPDGASELLVFRPRRDANAARLTLPVVDELRILVDGCVRERIRHPQEHAAGSASTVPSSSSTAPIASTAPSRSRAISPRPAAVDRPAPGADIGCRACPSSTIGGEAHRCGSSSHRAWWPDASVQHTWKTLEALRRQVVGDDAVAVAAERQFEAGFVTVAAGEAALVCGFIIEFCRGLARREPVYQPSGGNLHVNRRSEAIAQLLETALAERFDRRSANCFRLCRSRSPSSRPAISGRSPSTR